MFEYGWFLQILKDPFMPCMKYVQLRFIGCRGGLNAAAEAVGDAPSLPLNPNDLRLSPQQIKPPNPLPPTFLPPT